MKRILLFGDSNTYGYMPAGVGRFDEQTRYPGVLRRLLGEGYEVIEDGLNGRTTAFDDPYVPGRCGLDDIARSVREADPDLLMVMLGNNDCKTFYNTTSADIAAGMLKVLTVARVVDPDVAVLLCAPPALGPSALANPRSHIDGQEALDASRGLPEAYRRLAEDHGFGFLDANEVVCSDPADGEHMDAAGHEAFAGLLARRIKTML